MDLTVLSKTYILGHLSNIHEKTKKKYKVLILDDYTYEIVKDIPRHEFFNFGIISIVKTTSIREDLHNYDAIYFIQPKNKSIKIMLTDFMDKKQKYNNVHCVFTYTLPNRIMNYIKKSRILSYISSLVEIYTNNKIIDNIVFGPNVIDDNIMDNNITDDNINKNTKQDNKITKSIVSICAMLDINPNIRHDKHPNTMRIVEKCSEKITKLRNENLINRDNGTLLILDRSYDHIVELLHDFTYKSMCYDLIDERILEMNHIIINDENKIISNDIWEKVGDMAIDEATEAIKHSVDNVNKMYDNKISKDVLNHKYVTGLNYEMKKRETLKIQTILAEKALYAFHNYNIEKLVEVERMILSGESGKNCWKEVMNIYQDTNIRGKDKYRIMLLYSAFFPTEWKNKSNMIEECDLTGYTQFISKKNRENIHISKKPIINDSKYFYYTPILKDIISNLIDDTLDENEFPKLDDTQINNTKHSKITKFKKYKGGIIVIFICGGITLSEIRVIRELIKNTGVPIVIGSDFIIRY